MTITTIVAPDQSCDPGAGVVFPAWRANKAIPRGEQAPQADRLPALPLQEEVLVDLITMLAIFDMR